MKNIKTTKLVALLACLCLVTACFVGGTLAKYTTSGTGASDTARVAKFGVTVTASTDNEFAKTYDKTDAEYEGTLSVESDTEVVAPGTNGTLADVTLSGTPEVAVRVTYDSVADFGDNWVANGTYYCPIEITVEGTTLKGNDFTKIEDFEKAIDDAIETLAKDYDANTNLSTVGNDAPSVSWNWEFEGNDNDKDTVLGDAANATISLTLTTTVTQID